MIGLAPFDPGEETGAVADELPLFPLDHVLLPGLPLPLHVFEPRYRQLVSDVSAGTGTGHGYFGVVLGWAPLQEPVPRPASNPVHGSALPSSAVGNARMADIGTVAEIVENEPYHDGRCDLLTVGSRRFRILKIDTTTQPYVCASVEYLTEPGGDASSADTRRARRLTQRYLTALREVSDAYAVVDSDAADPDRTDATTLSYEIAAQIQLTTAERQSLLAAPDARTRLRTEIGLLRRELAVFGTVVAVPVPARALVVPAGAN